MIYLLLSILFSSGLFVIFKYFKVFKIDTLKAIFINYIVAFLLGILLTEQEVQFSKIPKEPWFFGALILGALFVSVFFVMAKTAQVNGVATASVAGKMSVVVPIFFGVILYKESVSVLKVTGIIIALLAVYLTAVKSKNHIKTGSLLLPLLLFLGSGTIDTILKFVENNYVAKESVALFSGTLFGIAAFFGFFVLLIKYLKEQIAFGTKNIIAGILLGVPNYYSIVFLIKALQNKNLESSTLFTLNNVGIVLLSTFLGVLLFKEHLILKNKIGIVLAIIGITLIALA